MSGDRMKNNGSDRAGAATVPPNPVMEFWNEYFQKSGDQSRAFLESLQSMADPQRLQQKWLDVLGQNFDEFMRSPAFLEMMRQNVKTMTDLKKTQDQAIEETSRHFGAPLASDIHGLFERLSIIERGLLSRLESIEERLEAITRGGGVGVEAKAPATPARPKAKSLPTRTRPKAVKPKTTRRK